MTTMRISGSPVTALLDLESTITFIMHLHHTHPLGGHLGARKTLEKLWDHFHWPSMVAEVSNFVQWCPQSQRMSPY